MSIKRREEATIKKLLSVAEGKEVFDNDSVKWAKTLYKNNCVNWRGETTDSKRLYSEVIAEKLLESCYLAALKNIEVVKRSKSYALVTHKYEINPNSHREEEKFAIGLAKAHNEPECSDIEVKCKCFRVMDYQIPLKSAQSDRGVGKIDLVAKNEQEKEVYLLELKKDSSTETLLRCILEIYTYWCQLDHEKFIKDFAETKPRKLETNQGLTIIPAILIFKGSLPYNEYEELNEGKRPELAKLIGALEKNMRERQPEYSNPRFNFFEISKVVKPIK